MFLNKRNARVAAAAGVHPSQLSAVEEGNLLKPVLFVLRIVPFLNGGLIIDENHTAVDVYCSENDLTP